MNRWFLMTGLLLIFILPQISWSAGSQCPGPSCENIFNTVSDSVATLGKDPTTAQKITYQRRKTRRLNRQKSINQANMAKYKAKRQAWINSGNNL